MVHGDVRELAKGDLGSWKQQVGGGQLKNICSTGQWGLTNMKCRTKVEIKPRTKDQGKPAKVRFIKVEKRTNTIQSGGLSTTFK